MLIPIPNKAAEKETAPPHRFITSLLPSLTDIAFLLPLILFTSKSSSISTGSMCW